jgi:carboxylesterase
VISEEVNALVKNAEPLFDSLAGLIDEVRGVLDHIYTPTLVIQAEDDQMINTASATEIYDNVECDDKEIHWYKNAGHAITLGPKRDEVHEDVYRFLESLAWD